MMRNKLVNFATTGTLEGEKTKGSPRGKYMDGVTELHNRGKSTGLIRDSDDPMVSIMTAYSYHHAHVNDDGIAFVTDARQPPSNLLFITCWNKNWGHQRLWSSILLSDYL